MHEELVNRLGGLSLPKKSMVRLTGRLDMTIAVYNGRKTAKQQQQPSAPTATKLGNLYLYQTAHFGRFRLTASLLQSATQLCLVTLMISSVVIFYTVNKDLN